MNILGLIDIPNELLFLLSIGIITTFLPLKFLAKSASRKIEESLQKIANVLNFQKVDITKNKGIYKDKGVTLKYTRESDFPYLNIEVKFPDYSQPKLITTSYFSLTRKILNLKWNGFENTFNLSGNTALSFDDEAKSKLKYLFSKGYFTQFTNLSVWPPNKFRSPGFGKIIFELPWEITDDADSIRTALDIVAKIADQMPNPNK